MRRSFLLLTSAVLFNCTNPVRTNNNPKADTPTSQTTVPQKVAILSNDDKDTVNISTDDSTVIKYSKNDLKVILKKDPELSADVPNPPDICWGESIKISGDFDCESCRDNYYALYAYILKVKNGGDKYRRQRITVIELYRDINELFDHLDGGGTYFGHQYIRILGYAEWSMHVYRANNDDNFIKSYDISKQKSLYLTSLTQLVNDEVTYDPELSRVEKVKKIDDLVGKISAIGRLVTTHFYLEMAQEFQYSHY